MKQDFAKMFRHPKVGQILVQRGFDNEEDFPVLIMKFWFEAVNGFATVTAGYENNDEGLAKLNKAFEEFTEQKAIEQVNGFVEIGDKECQLNK
jgi:hypothetical protein